MKNQDLTPLEQRLEKIKPLPVGEQLEATITKLELKNAQDIFGDATKQDKEGIVIYVKVGGKEYRAAFYSLPDGEYMNQKSRLYAFTRKYGTRPRVGQKVNVEFSSKGYVNIIV